MLSSKSLNCELFIHRLSGHSFGLLNERNLSWENESMHEMPSFGLLEFRPMSDIVERLHRPLLTIISYIHTLSWHSFGLYTRVGDRRSPPLPMFRCSKNADTSPSPTESRPKSSQKPRFDSRRLDIPGPESLLVPVSLVVPSSFYDLLLSWRASVTCPSPYADLPQAR